MFHLCALNIAFGDMIEKCLGNITSDITLWGDECTHGNQLRPDDNTKYLMIYLCFHQLPGYWRCVDEGWVPIGALSYPQLQTVRSHFSGVLKAVLRFILLGTVNFVSGFHVKVCARQVFIKSRFASLVADEKAHKEATGVKGSSGRKMCSKCMNTFKGDFEDTDFCRNYKTAMPDCFRLHTNESFYECCDLLDAEHARMSSGEFKELEKNVGINRDHGSILWDAALRPHFRPVTSVYFDWAHTLVASGGTGQYNINCFVKTIISETGMDYANLDWEV